MQKQQTPQQPNRDPIDIERLPERDPPSRDPGAPSPARHPDPLKQPGDAPDVKPDVLANQGGGQHQPERQEDNRSRGPGTPQQDGNQPRPSQSGGVQQQRQKPGTSGAGPTPNPKQ